MLQLDSKFDVNVAIRSLTSGDPVWVTKKGKGYITGLYRLRDGVIGFEASFPAYKSRPKHSLHGQLHAVQAWRCFITSQGEDASYPLAKVRINGRLPKNGIEFKSGPNFGVLLAKTVVSGKFINFKDRNDLNIPVTITGIWKRKFEGEGSTFLFLGKTQRRQKLAGYYREYKNVGRILLPEIMQTTLANYKGTP